MLKDAIYYVLNMSIVGSAMMAVLLCLRWLVKSTIPKKYIYSLWSIILLRLLIPVSISSKWSIMNWLDTSRVTSIKVTGDILDISLDASQQDISLTHSNMMQTATTYFPIEHKTTTAEISFGIAGNIWFIGTMICILCVILIYGMTSKHIKRGVRHKNYEAKCNLYMKQLHMRNKVQVIQVDFLETPVAVGFIQPKIIIPKGIGQEEIDYILLHELSHIRRRDPLWKLLSLITVSVHWFNPMVWLFLYIFDRDMEMACDEKVLSHLPDSKRQAYAMTLTHIATKQQVTFAAFGSVAIKERIMNIGHYKRLPLIMCIVITIIGILLSIVLMTNPI